MGNPLSLEDLIATSTGDLQRQLYELINSTILRVAQQITVRVGEEAQRRATAEIRSRLDTAFGQGTFAGDFSLGGHFAGGANGQLQLTPARTPASTPASTPAKVARGSGAGKASRKGQKWSAECPFPGCKEKAIRSKMNFCASHSESLDAATKAKLRNEQKARKIGVTTL